MQSEHLTADTYTRMLAGERIAGEKLLAAHLAGGCEQCEDVIGSATAADRLDGIADRTLFSLAPQAASRDELGFERVMRRVRLEAEARGEATPPQTRRGSTRTLPLSLAAMLAFGGVLVLALQAVPRVRPRYEGTKGEVVVPDVTVSFVVADEDGAMEKGVPGGRYGEDRALMLRYELSTPAFVTVLRIAPNGEPDVLAEPGRIGAGPHDLSVNGLPAGVNLKGYVGRNRFVVVATAEPADGEKLSRVVSTVDGLAASIDSRDVNDSGAAWFDVEVVPGNGH